MPVVYNDNKEVFVSNPTDFPETSDTSSKVREVQEPIVKATIIAPGGRQNFISYETMRSDAK